MDRFKYWLDKEVSSSIYVGDFVYVYENIIIVNPGVFKEFQAYKKRYEQFKEDMDYIINN